MKLLRKEWRSFLLRESCWITLLSICTVSNVFAQASSSTTPPTMGDTTTPKKSHQIRPGILLADSLYVPRDSVKGDIDTIVRYVAKDSTVFDVPGKKMTLVNHAIVDYQDREMEAYTIVMDFTKNTMTAYSYDVDSVISSSLSLRRRIIRDTNRAASRGAPKLTEGPTVYTGEVIIYNFKSKRGTVQLGTTEMEGGFYYGEKIKQVAPNTLFVENGRYTTCDAPIPHYYFESPMMKVIMHDQIFAAPVILYVADVPIFVLPFGVFPNHESGRHSGLIMPGYQATGDKGYGLTHLGYYVVFNDYLDSRIQTDLWTIGGYNVDFFTEYNKRYLLSGPASIEGSYGLSRYSSASGFDTNWRITAMLPSLQLGYETQLSANLSFQSDKEFQNTATSQEQFLTQSVQSNASFSTGWEEQGISLSVGYSRSDNLNNGTYQEQSPSLTLSKTTWFPFQSGGGGATSNSGSWLDQTLSSFGVGYNLTASRSVQKNQNISATLDTTYSNTEQYSILHSPTISISPKFGHFSVTPSFSYTEAWIIHQHLRNNFYETYMRDTAGRIVDSVTQYDGSTTTGFNRLYTYSGAIGVSTTLYGIANIGAFGIQAIRHTVIPSVSFLYHPDLSGKNQNNNYRAYYDPTTRDTQYYNIFDGEPNGTLVGRGKAATLSLSLGNDFEAKVERTVTKDSTTVDHVKLFHIDASSGYDLVTKILSPLSLSANSSIGTLFSLSGNANFSFYPQNYSGGDSTNYSLRSLGQGLLRPQNVSASLSGSFSASKTVEGENYDSLRRLFKIASPDDERTFFLGGYYPGTYIDVPYRPKWNISYGLSYQLAFTAATAGNAATVEKDFGANASLSLPLTINWLISTTASYDLTAKKVLIPQITIHRDLHCWEMDLSYRPPGSQLSGFNFEIRIKAPQLQDIKLTRTENNYGEF